MSRQRLVWLGLAAALALSSCSLLAVRRKPPRSELPPPAPPPAERGMVLMATGTSPVSPESARAVATLYLQALLADSLASALGPGRAPLPRGDEVSTDRLARAEAEAIVRRGWPALAPGVRPAAGPDDPVRVAGGWSSRVRLRVRNSDREQLLRETRARTAARVARFVALADSTEAVVAGGSFGGALEALEGFLARGCTEWLIPPTDLAPMVGHRLDPLVRNLRIRFVGGYFEECLYFLSVRVEDPAGRALAGVPLMATVPADAGHIVEPSLPTNTVGEVVFALEPGDTDTVMVTLEVPRHQLIRRSEVPREAAPWLASALGRLPQVRDAQAIDFSPYRRVAWNVELLPRWTRRRGLFGSSLELLGLKGSLSISSDAPFRRRFSVRCTKAVVGGKSWIPAGEVLLLASFRISDSGPQVRNLATIRLAEFVSGALRKAGKKADGPIRLLLSLDVGAACSWPATTIEQWVELPPPPDRRSGRP